MLRARTSSASPSSKLDRVRPEGGYKRTQRTVEKKSTSEAACPGISRSVKYKWSLLSPYSRSTLTVLGVLLLCHSVLGALDIFFRYYGVERQGTIRTPSTGSTKSFAVVINTYKRPAMLRDAVRHYAETCGPKFGVSQVFVVWTEETVTPPRPESFLVGGESSLRRNDGNLQERSSVHVLRGRKDSLNSRFEPIQDLQSEGIFMVDDDIRISCRTLYQGFQAWAESPDGMSGYYPRLATRDPLDPDQYQYHTWRTVYWQERLNFVLTKACFMHSKYLSIFSDPTLHPHEILEYVDKHMNCEDIAMSMLVANYTKATIGATAFPTYVEGSVTDKGLFGGISWGRGHFSMRSECLTDLTKIYQRHEWGSPLVESASLRKQSWLHHFPGFWWQWRSSHTLEWVAFG